MHTSYRDIRSRIHEQPKWFDANGVPRYDAFTPDLRSDIYAREVCLLEIVCQTCDEHFLVEVCNTYGQSLRTDISKGVVTYKDPPAHCCSGDCQMSLTLKIVEMWILRQGKWNRCCVQLIERLVGIDEHAFARVPRE